jgi:hypothetical protein
VTNTFYSWICLVIFSTIFVFIFQINFVQLLDYREIINLIGGIIAILIFLTNIVYSVNFIRFQFFGDIDDFLECVNEEETKGLLRTKFDSLIYNKQRNERIISELAKSFSTEFPLLFISPTYYLLMSTKRLFKKS